MIRYVDQLEVSGQCVFVRVDFNVSLDDEQRIVDDLRIRQALPTIRYLQEQGARVILASHLGRPKGKINPKYSLLPVAQHLTDLLNQEVIFPESCVGDAVIKLTRDLREGELILLENLRFHPEEEANDSGFAEQLASYAEVYVNDAFGTLHRAHASTSRMADSFEEKGAGFLVRDELRALNALIESPKRPFWGILGGAKVSDKIGVIERLLDKVDGLLLGGALAYTFLKAQGHEIGKSRLEEEKIHVARKALEKATSRDIPLLLPIDHRVAKSMDAGVEARVIDSADIPADWIGLDIGPQTVKRFQEALAKAQMIFWNGPLGYFEVTPFAEGTKKIAQAVADSQAISVVGGGDSLAALKSLGMEDKVSYLSTGGGASLEYLEGKELPGLRALEEGI